MSFDPIAHAISVAHYGRATKATVKESEADLNQQRLLTALENAINSRLLIPAEQAKYDQRIDQLQQDRDDLIKGNFPPDEILKVEDDIADAIYHRWLVEQQLSRASEAAIQRKAYLETLNTHELQQEEKQRCGDGLEGLFHWWSHWAWTCDPRPDSPLMYVPFILFQCQEELLEWMYRLVYERHKDGHLDKSRDLGASWMVAVFAEWGWLTAAANNPFLATFGSRKEQFVDKVGDPDTLLEKIRIGLRLVPGWQLPRNFKFETHAPTLKILNPETGSLIKGESANVNFARAGRQTWVVFDEFAAWPEGGYAAWTAASESSRTRFAISTPQGQFNKFGELKTDKHIPHFSLSWKQHPWKTQQAYEIAGRRLSEVELAQEWDLDYEGSVAGRLLWMFSEIHHVITWSEFVALFGSGALDELGRPRIPKGWKHRIAHDCGTTDDHPSIIAGAAMSPANSPLPRHLFFYEQVYMGEGAHPLLLAPIIKEKFQRYIKDGDIEAWMISHEANAERLIYNQEFGLPFETWNTEAGYTQGYPQSQHYLTPYPGRHPFRPDVEGHPRCFFIVEDRQGTMRAKPDVSGYLPWPVMQSAGRRPDPKEMKKWVQLLLGAAKSRFEVNPPLNDEGGFKRAREEMPRIHIPQSEAGKPTLAQRHFKRFDDFFDVFRAILAQMPGMVALTPREKAQQRLQTAFKDEQLKQTMQAEGYQAYYAYQEELHEIEKDLDREQSDGRDSLAGKTIQTFRDRFRV